MKKILITGAEGFIGSHLTEKVSSLGYNVRATCLYNSFNSLGWLEAINKKNSKKIEIIKCDITDSNIANELVKGCDIVINLASLIGIPYSYIAPESYVNNNIYLTLNLLNACRNFKIEKFIHTSTSEVYGNPIYLPIDENHPLQAHSPYAATKISSDQLVMSYFRSFKLNATILRPFNTFGPRQSLRAVIPTIISQILNGKKNIMIGEVSSKRDISFIDDTVDGFIRSINSKKCIGETINLGTGCSFSVDDTVKIISKIIGKKISVKKDKKRLRPKSSEIFNLLSDNQKAKQLLSWKPKYVNHKGFVKGLEKTIKWYSNKKNIDKFIDLNYVV